MRSGQHRRRQRAVLLLGALSLACVAARAAPAAEGREVSTPVARARAIGANLPVIADWSATPVYADLVRQARHFGSPDAPWDEAAVLGPDGWPVGDFGVFLMTGQSGLAGTAGTYHVAFDGEAVVGVVASDAYVAHQVFDAERGRTSLDVVVREGADQLALSFTQTRGGIKALTVVRPGYPATGTPLFTTAFLAHLARFQVLRFMDWLATNTQHGAVAWDARPTPERVHHAGSAGVPWEHVIALANETGKDLWINIPVRAGDDYVRELARLLHATLRPDLRVYVEYSNELWNAGFGQYAANLELATADVAADPGSPLAYDGTTDLNVLAYRRVALRVKEIGDVFRSEYGDAAMMRTIRPVLAGQVVQPYIAALGLAFLDAVYGPPARHVYALAGAPYFNLGGAQTAEGLDTDAVLSAMQDSVAALPAVNAFEKNRALASWYGLQWVAYEAGADTFGPGSIAAKAAAGLDPRFFPLCLDYLRAWDEWGGDLLLWFTAGAGRWDGPYGTWELTRDLAVTDTPKLRCLDEAVVHGPAPAHHGHAVPGRFPAGAHVGSTDRAATVRHLPVGHAVDYLIHASHAGPLLLTLTTEAAAPGNVLGVAVNHGDEVGVAIEPAGWDVPVPQAGVVLRLAAGYNTLRITTRAATTGYGLHAIELRAGREVVAP